LVADEIGSKAHVSILDFGCGIGNATRALERAFAHASLTGCDRSVESIRVARELTAGSARAQYVELPESGLPFPDGSFDVVFSSNVFHHVDRVDQIRWGSELARVLTPDGSALLFEHNPYNPLTRRAVAGTTSGTLSIAAGPGRWASTSSTAALTCWRRRSGT
jgi:SAM-dependent methyltransferase